jgi:SAM-dependent methyltransferase
MYLDALNLWDLFKKATVLHIAAESHLVERIHAHKPTFYVRGDLVPVSPDIERIDITAIPYPSHHFNFVMCNHVLEHVPDDERACSELFRVIKPGGCAVLQTPYSPILQNSFVDPGINTDELRNRYYGQEDHVPLYGRDLFARITNADSDSM